MAYLFDKRGIIRLAADADEDTALELALEAGAEDIENEDDALAVVTSPERFSAVVDALKDGGLALEHAEVAMVPSATAACDAEAAAKVLRLLDALDDLDDVQNVYSNAELPDGAFPD